jgi:hypothetical protein
MLPISSLSRIGLLTLAFGASACGSGGTGLNLSGNGGSLGKGGGTAQIGAGGVVSDGGAAAGGSVGFGGEASGGIIGAGGLIVSAGTGGVPTGGMVMGGVTGSEGGAVDAGSDGAMCNGVLLPAGAATYPLCLSVATMVVCNSCEGPQHPECAAVCVNHGCLSCGSSGWIHSRVDCGMTCSTDAGRGGAGGAISTGGVPAAGGATGTSAMTLAEACTRNCALASGLATCSTTPTVCMQSCMTTFTNTSAVNPDLGRQYTNMMICIATNFTSSNQFVCAKPNRPLNKWSPGPGSDCEQIICDWNCSDGTLGNFDPWVDIRCQCAVV